MNCRFITFIVILFAFSLAGCGYRFVDPLPASDYALVSVRNSTAEPGLAQLLEGELRRSGGFAARSTSRLSVTVTGFSETVESVGADGTPVRQKLTMEVSWKVEGLQAPSIAFGRDVFIRSYPYSKDSSSLDFSRNSAIHLLTEMAARGVLEGLGGQP